MPFAAVGAAVSVAGTVIGSSMAADATQSAADSSAQVQREAMAQQRELADRAREDLMPFADAGRNALLATSDLSGLNGPEAARNALLGFVESPGRQYALDQGRRGIERTAAARGGLLSGNTLRQVEEFGQNLADQSFGTYYNRLADLSKGGQAAIVGQQNASNTLSQEIGKGSAGIAQTMTSAGGQLASIYSGAANNISGAVNQGLGNYLYMQKTQPQNALFGSASSAFDGAGTSVGGATNAGW